jgi:hypothetical protein
LRDDRTGGRDPNEKVVAQEYGASKISEKAQNLDATAPPEYAPASLSGEAGSISSRVFSSFDDVPRAWRSLIPRADLAMDPDVLRIFQRTLADQCLCWGVIVYDHGAAIGCAALCLFQTELAGDSHPMLTRLRDRIRRVWPGFMRVKVLFCGLPTPSGATHLRASADARHVRLLAAEVDRVMRRIARTVGAKLLVFKELEETSGALAQALTQAGYVHGGIPPMHILNRSFKSFADYRDALRSRYRAQIQRSQKKLEAAGFEALSGRGGAFFDAHWNDDVHRLYVAVQRRAEQKLELMPAAFFRELAHALGDEVSLTLIRRAGRVCAFTFAITRAGTHYNLYSGLDYALNADGDLYFNLFYCDLDQAFRSGATSVHLGQTSDSFKSRLGSATQPLHFFVRARAAWQNAALRLLAPVAFPAAPSVRSQDVFARDRR